MSDSMDPKLASLFPGRPADPSSESAQKSLRTLNRGVKHGWEYEMATPYTRAALSSEEWGRVILPFLLRPSVGVLEFAPLWLGVLVDALAQKYRTDFLDRGGKVTHTKFGRSGGFLEMVVSWCASGGKDALEGRARPLAAIILLASGKADIERRVNHFMNEVGF